MPLVDSHLENSRDSFELGLGVRVETRGSPRPCPSVAIVRIRDSQCVESQDERHVPFRHWILPFESVLDMFVSKESFETQRRGPEPTSPRQKHVAPVLWKFAIETRRKLVHGLLWIW